MLAKTEVAWRRIGEGAARLSAPRGGIYFRRAPTGTSSRKPASTGLPSGPAEAATIMPLDSTPRSLRGCEIHDHDDFAPDQLLRLVGRGDAGDDLAHFVADIHHQLQQFVGTGDALGRFHQADAHLDLGEIVDADARGGLIA